MTQAGAPHVQLRGVVADIDATRWDVFVHSAPGAQFSHLYGWRHIVEDVLGREYIALAALTSEGECEGLLPLVRVRAPLLGHSLISMPYLNYGGPIGSPAAQQVLVDAALAEARRSGAGMLQLRMREPLTFAPPQPVRKVIALLELPEAADDLWTGFPAKLRSQIRRPQKEGMEFRTGREHVGAFYEVFARNMRDLGTPVYPRRFFEAIAATFEHALFGAVYWRDRPVAAGCGFVWRGEFEITWASAIRDYNRLSPNMLLYWSLMEELIRRGVRTFNFGRSTPGASTHAFKTQWGGRDVPLPWVDVALRDTASSAGPSSAARLASAVWRHLPLALANRAGPFLAARLPWW